MQMKNNVKINESWKKSHENNRIMQIKITLN